MKQCESYDPAEIEPLIIERIIVKAKKFIDKHTYVTVNRDGSVPVLECEPKWIKNKIYKKKKKKTYLTTKNYFKV